MVTENGNVYPNELWGYNTILQNNARCPVLASHARQRHAICWNANIGLIGE